MTAWPPPSSRWGRRGVILAAALFPLVAAPGADDTVPVAEPAGQPISRPPNMIDLGANFDPNLFDQPGNGWSIRHGVQGVREGDDRIHDSPALSRSRTLGGKQIERIDAACGLSAEQRRRLKLAVESDARWFATEIDTIRGRYAGNNVNMNDVAGQKQWHAFQQDVQRCRNRLRQMFGEESLFAASLPATLDERQLACLAAERASRRSFHWRAMVAEVLVRLDDTLGLSQRQHEELEKMLLAREPPLRIDEAAVLRDDPNVRRHLVLLVLSEVDGRVLRAAVSDRQWPALAALANQGKGMRSWVEQQGVLEKPGG